MVMRGSAVTLALAGRAAGAPTEPALGRGYRAGACNIGRDEIGRRRRAGHAGLVATLALWGLLIVIGAPPPARLLLIVPAGGAAIGYLQAWFRFCAGFGMRGISNFGRLGESEAVIDPVARARDRRRALQLGVASLAFGVLVGVVATLITF
jgi:hypothetical protein